MIQKIIHQICLGSLDIERYRPLINSVKEYTPGYEYRLWTDENIHELPEFGKIASKVLPLSYGADLLKAEILYRIGGFIIDLDLRLTNSLDDLQRDDIVLTREARNTSYTACFIGSNKGNDFSFSYFEAIKAFNRNLKEGATDSTGITGRTLLQKALNKCNDCEYFIPRLRMSHNKKLGPTGEWFIIDIRKVEVIGVHYTEGTWNKVPFTRIKK